MTKHAVVFMALLATIASTSYARSAKIITHTNAIPSSYIVELNSVARDDVEPLVRALARQHGVNIARVGGREAIFTNALQAFGGEMSDAAAEALAADPRVRVVEQNARVFASRTLSDDRQWNIDRIDQTFAVKDSPTHYVGDHSYSAQTTGAGIYVYVIDSGVSRDHPEFIASNIKDGPHFSSDVYTATNPCGGRVGYNTYSFGTHGTGVASVIAGQTVGVAPDAYIVPVKVGNCDGYAELLWWCYGVDWVHSSPDPAHPNDLQYGNPYPKTGAIANMSIFIDSADPWDHTTPISSFENAVNNVIAAGVTVVVAANNQYNPNCTTSPARLGQGNSPYVTIPGYGDPNYRVITVGGTDELDHLWHALDWNDEFAGNPGSNTGQCVDIYAPAHNVKVAWYGSEDYRAPGGASSGTSFAAPIVAGLAARIQQMYNGTLSPQQVWIQISNRAKPLAANFDGDNVSINDRIAYMLPWE